MIGRHACLSAKSLFYPNVGRMMVKDTLRNLRYARMNSVVVRHLLGPLYRSGQIYTIPFGPLRGLHSL